MPTQTPRPVLCGGLPWVLCTDSPPMRSRKTNKNLGGPNKKRKNKTLSILLHYCNDNRGYYDSCRFLSLLRRLAGRYNLDVVSPSSGHESDCILNPQTCLLINEHLNLTSVSCFLSISMVFTNSKYHYSFSPALHVSNNKQKEPPKKRRLIENKENNPTNIYTVKPTCKLIITCWYLGIC